MKEEKSVTWKRVEEMLTSGKFNKVALSEEVGISRPTLNTRISQDKWKKSEVIMVKNLYDKN